MRAVLVGDSSGGKGEVLEPENRLGYRGMKGEHQTYCDFERASFAYGSHTL